MYWSASIRICTREKLDHSGMEEVFDTGKWLHQDMDPHIEQLHRYGSRVRLDFSGFVKSMRPHNGNSDSSCDYVAQRYVDDTALIEPFNSTQRTLTLSMYSNMILNDNSRAYAEIWRWTWRYCFNHPYGTFDMFVHRSNGFIVCDETCWYISSSHLGSI